MAGKHQAAPAGEDEQALADQGERQGAGCRLSQGGICSAADFGSGYQGDVGGVRRRPVVGQAGQSRLLQQAPVRQHLLFPVRVEEEFHAVHGTAVRC
jgi:hypothetical protein